MIAVCGRSNVGKSSFINMLANQNKLARTSAEPGRTRLVNYFDFGEFVLADLPGYGFARVSKAEKEKWAKLLDDFFAHSEIAHVFSLVDIRHDPTEDDRLMINYLYGTRMPFTILATKADKLASGARKAQLNMVREAVLAFNGDVQVETFSSLKKQGVDKLRQKLDTWFSEMQPVEETQDGE